MTTTARRRFVLLHGWGVNRCVWGPVVDLLTPHHEVYTRDLPLHQGDARTQAMDALRGMAETISASIPEAAIWVGWSLGGMVAIQAALQRPALVSQLVLVGCNPKFVADARWKHGVDAKTMDRFCEDFCRDYHSTLRRFLLLQSGNCDGSRTLARRIGNFINECGPPGELALRRGLEILKHGDLRPVLPRLRVSTHVIHGRSDRLVPPAAAQYLTRQIPRGRLSWLTSGHAPFMTHPQDFVRLLEEHRA